MKTMTLEADVGQDGNLHLDILVDLPPGRVEVVVVLQL